MAIDLNDPVTTAAHNAWLEYAKGTYSNTDKRIFIAGFMAGNRYRQQGEEQRGQSRENTTQDPR
jgi:hypothetical protein